LSNLNKRNPIAKAVKVALLAAASVSAFTAPTVFAAEAEEEATEDTKITITGSRIRRTEFISESAVAVMNAEQFELTGTVNTEDLLNTLPQAVPGLDRTSNNPGNGTATVNLRGLGSNRTLVLINGSRALPASQGGSVDINSIPTSMIERVEVLTGGASAVYGSDAVAGVVNFILKDDFEGVEVRAGYQENSEGSDGSQFTTDFTLGGNFDDGKGNLVFNMQLTSRDAVMQGDRDFSFFAQTDSTDANGNVVLINGGSTGVPGTSIFSGNLPQFPSFGGLFGTDGSFNEFRTVGDDNDFYNYAPVNFLQVPQERQQSTVLGHYEYADNHEVYARAMFTRSVVDNQLAPTPIFQTSTFTLDGSPFINGAAQQTISDAFGDGVDTDGDGIDDTASAFVRRRLLEVGPRFANQQRTSYQFKWGLKGDIGDTNFFYDAYYQEGEVSANNSQSGNVNRGRFNQALLLDLAADPAGGVCQNTSANGSTIGCAPINIFGQGNISEAGAAFINTATATVSEVKQTVYSAIIGGDSESMFELQGGSVGFVAGFEYIENEGDFRASQDVAAGTIAGFNGAPPTGGKYDVESYFVEIDLPILRDVAAAESLDLKLAFRTSDYSTVGTVSNSKVGLTWQPVESLFFRASFNTAIRAPSIAELFSPVSEGFPPSSDPCSAGSGTTDASPNGAATRAICEATGVPSNVVFTPALNLAAGQVRALSGGNELLTEEEATTQTFGVVFTPMDNLSVSLDYFDVEIEDLIAAFGGGANNILQTCYDPTNSLSGIGSAFCNSVNRRADGTIDFIQSGTQNVAVSQLTGFDVIGHYNFELGAGRFDVDTIITFTDENSVLNFEGDPSGPIECAGFFGQTCGTPTPEVKARTTFKWTIDDFRTQLLWRFIGDTDDDDDGTVFATEKLDSESYFDISAAYNIDEHFSVSGGIRNLADTKPQLLGSNGQQANTFPNVYDVFGRSFYLNVTAKF
jgi:iron complex outermembrane receptor protein